MAPKRKRGEKIAESPNAGKKLKNIKKKVTGIKNEPQDDKFNLQEDQTIILSEETQKIKQEPIDESKKKPTRESKRKINLELNATYVVNDTKTKGKKPVKLEIPENVDAPRSRRNNNKGENTFLIEKSDDENKTTLLKKSPPRRGKRKIKVEEDQEAPKIDKRRRGQKNTVKHEDEQMPEVTKKTRTKRGMKKELSQSPKEDKPTKSTKQKVANDSNAEQKPIPRKRGAKNSGAQPTSGMNKKVEPKREAVQRCVLKKGKAPVDGLCPIASTAHVYCQFDDQLGEEVIWDCMLNQTNIQFNNNKYYLIQLLEDDYKKTYSVWMRWGRVGAPGQNALKPCASNLQKAMEIFKKKFSDKTKNMWEDKNEFEKVPGKYDLLKMDYSLNDQSSVDTVDAKTKKMEAVKLECSLEKCVKNLIELICDIKAMEQAVIEMKYDAKKAPLGKLTADQVKAGYAALKEIDNCISGSGKTTNRDLLQACNDFYTRIPHYFGMKVPPMIRTKSDVKEKMVLLEALADIEAAMDAIGKVTDDTMHPTDQHYKGLACDIEILDKSSTKYMTLEKYLQTTHGYTHSMYDLEVEEIFAVSRKSENDRFKDVGNRMLLWHGSRLTNWAGILSQGLRIAPPEAPVTGYMFGKGIYFADISTKSANYCMATNNNKVGILVLCDVSLGKSRDLQHADYKADKLPKGFHSVKGVGKTIPDPKNVCDLDGATVPMGPSITSPKSEWGSLQYNEYIVYDPAQVKIKYLFKVKFNFKY